MHANYMMNGRLHQNIHVAPVFACHSAHRQRQTKYSKIWG